MDVRKIKTAPGLEFDCSLAGPPDGVPVATPAPVQDSSMLTKLARADCLLIREPHAPEAKAGEPCSIITLAS